MASKEFQFEMSATHLNLIGHAECQPNDFLDHLLTFNEKFG